MVAQLLADLTPLYYFLWDHVKSLVYESPVDSEEDLLARVMDTADVGLQAISDSVYVGTVVLKSLVAHRGLLVNGPRRTTA